MRWPAVLAFVAAICVMPHTGCLLTTPLDGLAGELPPADDGGGLVDGCVPGTSDCDATPGCETTTATDPKNCGKCGRDCLEGTCEAGVCKPIKLADTAGAKALAVEPGNVYWVTDQGAVYWGKNGGTDRDLIASGQSIGDSPSVAADTDSIFWTTSVAVIKANKSTKALTTVASSQNKPKSLALYSSNAYWIQDRSVMRAPKSGGATTIIADEASAPEQVKVDASGVYWVVYGSNELRFAAHTGGTPSTLNAEYVGPKSLALRGEAVFVTEEGSDKGFLNGVVSKVPKTGGTKQVIASTQLYPEGIDTDSTDVYWANFNGGAVVRVQQSGGATPVRVADAPSPTVVASPDADSYVWWIAADGISKVAK